VYDSLWTLSVTGSRIDVDGKWGPMTFHDGRIVGDRITLAWSGMWVGGAGGTFEGRLVSPGRIEGRWRSQMIFSNIWWAEKQ